MPDGAATTVAVMTSLVPLGKAGGHHHTDALIGSCWSHNRPCSSNNTSCWSSLLSLLLTVYWHRPNQTKHWPYEARQLAGQPPEYQYWSHWYDLTTGQSRGPPQHCCCGDGHLTIVPVLKSLVWPDNRTKQGATPTLLLWWWTPYHSTSTEVTGITWQTKQGATPTLLWWWTPYHSTSTEVTGITWQSRGLPPYCCCGDGHLTIVPVLKSMVWPDRQSRGPPPHCCSGDGHLTIVPVLKSLV